MIIAYCIVMAEIRSGIRFIIHRNFDKVDYGSFMSVKKFTVRLLTNIPSPESFPFTVSDGKFYPSCTLSM
ncbi:uncharacterized protein CANTADRAFT_261610 [Suhomyces tanzawaensis NRRL Y-17324]|uniref:Uncharacterized protein n=1 Tax=Suhomyces tanzawaensis NRRL Y-17324 TaxID=984487 RepID=A0A1E4SJ16_9ASCO|nr:uncharacterized protein CANTADRAFT_261610 [Suhomyces tanzawaensis NRRL Y-17324]ODV79503.1 hypothetical protein CANTADRAFT_261610 [Suhomyces tanzawaensis NRRL Y-17324]